MRRAVVTGAGGFIGRRLVAELSQRDFHVRTIRMKLETSGSQPFFSLDGQFEASRDLVDLLADARPDVIFHLAGIVQTNSPELLFDVNVRYALDLIEAVRHARLPTTIVLTGSAAEYGEIEDALLPVSEDYPCRPRTPYGTSKYAQTLVGLAAGATGVPIVVARLFNVVGTGMPEHLPLAEIARRLADSQTSGELRVGHLDLERDYIDVGDVVRVLPGLALNPDATGQVVNVCSGHGVDFRQVVDGMIASVPWPVRLVVDSKLSMGGPIRRSIGSPDRLMRLGLSMPRPSFDALLPAIVADGLRRSGSHRQSTRGI